MVLMVLDIVEAFEDVLDVRTIDEDVDAVVPLSM
jgi:hypothetical protein